MAEGVGFEPTRQVFARLPHFECGSFNRSDTPPCQEKPPEKTFADLLQNASRDFNFPSCADLGEEVPPGPARSPLPVRRSEDDPVEAGVGDGGSAHRARLERDKERAAVEPPV